MATFRTQKVRLTRQRAQSGRVVVIHCQSNGRDGLLAVEGVSVKHARPMRAQSLHRAPVRGARRPVYGPQAVAVHGVHLRAQAHLTAPNNERGKNQILLKCVMTLSRELYDRWLGWLGADLAPFGRSFELLAQEVSASANDC